MPPFYLSLAASLVASLLLATAYPLNDTLPKRCGVDGCPVNQCSYGTVLFDGGNPRQSYLHRQVSENIACGAGGDGCSVSHAEGTTISVSFSVGASDVDGWISGGFDVSKTWSTTDTYTCNGDEGDTVCVWMNIAHTTYDVATREICSLETSLQDQTTLNSPNSANQGGGFYCVVGTCRSDGEEYWDFDVVDGTATD